MRISHTIGRPAQPVVGVVERCRRHREQRDERAPESSHGAEERRTLGPASGPRLASRRTSPSRSASSITSLRFESSLAIRPRAQASGDCPELDAANHRHRERVACARMSDDAKTDQDEKKPDYEPPAGAEIEGTWTGGPASVDYTATAKWLVLRKKEKPAAEIFSISYVAKGGDEDRPVTFVFNGGPGASSAYLHMGAVGPKRVEFPPDGSLPEMPPQARAERVVVARVHRPRLRRPGRDRVQPDHREREEGRRQGRQEGRRRRPEGVLRLQARSRVALRVHGPLALRPRPLGIADLHRRRELRRLPRRAARAHAAGDRRASG